MGGGKGREEKRGDEWVIKVYYGISNTNETVREEGLLTYADTGFTD